MPWFLLKEPKLAVADSTVLSWLIMPAEKQSLQEPVALGWRQMEKDLQVQQPKTNAPHCGSGEWKSFPTLAI